MDKAYSKRELDLKFKGIEEKIDANTRNSQEKSDAWNGSILEKLSDLDKFRMQPTLEQVKKTNGRVSSLEKWRTWLTGAAAVVMVAVGFAGFWFREYVHTLVVDEFSAYKIQADVNISND